jgi:FtsH-binding integral membrane protein
LEADIGEIITIAGLASSLILLLILIYRHANADVPRLASFKTWLAIALVIWIAGELVNLMGLSLALARTIHTVSMVLFPLIIIVKGRKLLRRRLR